ncbi:MAG: tetratricopeptide repeat protein [Verrucomicrobiia bacterium]
MVLRENNDERDLYCCNRRTVWMIAAAIAAITIIVFLPVIYYEFLVYDDPDYVTLNPYVLNGLTLEGIKWAFVNLHTDKTYWHPLTWIFLFLDCQLFGANPGAMHLMNLCYHVINAILVFFVLHRLSGSIGKSAVVAAIFALHPIQIETVVWISERKNLLTALFALLVLLSYLKYVGSSKIKYYILAILFYAFSLMSKPALTPLPFLLLVLDFYPLRRIVFRDDKRNVGAKARIAFKKAIIEKIPFLALSAISCAITILAHKALGGIMHNLPIILRLQNAIVAYAEYVKKTIIPTGFAIVYPHPGIWDETTVYGSLVLLLAITVYVLFMSRRERMALVGWLWFIGMLVPASGIVQAGIQSMALRFVYFPAIGLFMMFVWIVAERLEGVSLFKLRMDKLAAGLTICACIVLTSNQLNYWQNSITLFEQTLKNTRNNFIAHCNYGLALFYQGNLAEAKEHFLDALAIHPRFVEARLNLGMVFEKEGNLSAAEEQYKIAIEIQPDIPFGWKALARVLNKSGNKQDALKAARVCEKMNPGDPELQYMLGYLYSANKSPREAIEHYKRCIELNPEHPAALNNLAWLLATLTDDSLRDGKRAVEYALKANALTGGRNVIILGTLAAAYAEAGRFDEAVKTAQIAIQLAIEKDEKELIEKNKKLLNLYLQSRPYREALE